MPMFGFETEGIEVVQNFKQHVEGKTIVITGASAKGLGAETAISLAHGNPAHLFLLGRSASKVNPVMDDIKQINPSIKVTFVPVELDDLDSVRKGANDISSRTSQVHCLINNAGIMAVKAYTTNKAGIESQFATNHLGHFLLTNLLMPQIFAAAREQGARIVNLTSDGYKISPFRFEDYNFSQGKLYNMWAGYGQSKTANILFTAELASRFRQRGIQCQSFAVHPGVIMTTSLGGHLEQDDFAGINAASLIFSGEPFQVGKPKSPQQGVSTTLVAALDPEISTQSGRYMEDCQVKEARAYATSKQNASRLWSLSEALVGEKFQF